MATVLLVALAAAPERARAQSPSPVDTTVSGAPGGAAPAPARTQIRASRVSGPISLDGDLSEPVWQSAEPFTAMIQRDPIEGRPPSQRTEVRVAFDDASIYIGARLWDDAPDSIAVRLARRDVSTPSDRFAVYLDPYHDRRSGYYFMVNAAGTLYDGTLANDVDTDKSWDGVWDARVRVDAHGWTAEMRIPYSQLRFQRLEQHVWGINFGRDIPRRQEKDYAVYRPRKASGFVSRFPDLVGVDDIAPRPKVEIVPYASAQAEYLNHKPGDPFNDGSRLRTKAGADLRAGIASRATLNATINPDFGQVEVDPAVVNLTDYESFFDEKRPFFVEGAPTFKFGRQGAGDYWDFDWDDPLFFYSRRIGREPQGDVPKATYKDVPAATQILGAGKLIGRLAPNWTVGALGAVTDRMEAQLYNKGVHSEAVVEPLTGYGVIRTQREFADRKVGLGLIGTAVARRFDESSLPDQLSRSSLLGGVDGWVFLDEHEVWVISGWAAASQVKGDPARMVDLQRSSTHYFQRPDASHVEVDSTRTSLAGYGTRVWLNKQKGAARFNAAFGDVSPGFDVNDLGYQQRSDLLNGHVGTGYKWTQPTRFWRYESFEIAAYTTQDHDGNILKRGGQVSGYTEFHNGYTTNYYLGYNLEALNNRRTRGGPLTVDPPRLSYGGDFGTDANRQWYAYVSADYQTSTSGTMYLDVYPSLEWRPTPALSLKAGPGWEWLHEDAQYVASFADTTALETYGRRYVFAALEQNTISAVLRVNWTFTPRLSLETFVQPFVSSAGYSDFKSLVRPRSYEFVPSSYTDDNLNFTVRSLKGDAVLRWEFRPGSAMFVVWTQDRSGYETTASFSARPDLLWNAKPENVFLTKVSYYFTP